MAVIHAAEYLKRIPLPTNAQDASKPAQHEDARFRPTGCSRCGCHHVVNPRSRFDVGECWRDVNKFCTMPATGECALCVAAPSAASSAKPQRPASKPRGYVPVSLEDHGPLQYVLGEAKNAPMSRMPRIVDPAAIAAAMGAKARQAARAAKAARHPLSAIVLRTTAGRVHGPSIAVPLADVLRPRRLPPSFAASQPTAPPLVDMQRLAALVLTDLSHIIMLFLWTGAQCGSSAQRDRSARSSIWSADRKAP